LFFAGDLSFENAQLRSLPGLEVGSTHVVRPSPPRGRSYHFPRQWTPPPVDDDMGTNRFPAAQNGQLAGVATASCCRDSPLRRTDDIVDDDDGGDDVLQPPVVTGHYEAIGDRVTASDDEDGCVGSAVADVSERRSLQDKFKTATPKMQIPESTV
jgi:hypothetical protein